MANLGMRLGGLTVGLVGAFSRDRTRSPRRPVQRAAKAGSKHPGQSRFQAVEVKRGIDACQAAEALEGQRFLARQAPALPLPDCDRSACNCRYRKFADRRRDGDRRFVRGRYADISRVSVDERRGRTVGRRQDD